MKDWEIYEKKIFEKLHNEFKDFEINEKSVIIVVIMSLL